MRLPKRRKNSTVIGLTLTFLMIFWLYLEVNNLEINIQTREKRATYEEDQESYFSVFSDEISSPWQKPSPLDLNIRLDHLQLQFSDKFLLGAAESYLLEQSKLENTRSRHVGRYQ